MTVHNIRRRKFFELNLLRINICFGVNSMESSSLHVDQEECMRDVCVASASSPKMQGTFTLTPWKQGLSAVRLSMIGIFVQTYWFGHNTFLVEIYILIKIFFQSYCLILWELFQLSILGHQPICLHNYNEKNVFRIV